MEDARAQLTAKLQDRSAQVAIIGLGYVGLPLALTFCEAGFEVVGLDVDADKIARLADGGSYISHVAAARVCAALDEQRFRPTTDFAWLAAADAILIAVPTPLTPQREPDMRYVVETCEQVAKTLRPGQLVVLESTTYPGTTDELVRGILDASGLVCGRDYFLAFSPEREDPGNQQFDARDVPKIVGGVDAPSAEIAQALYRHAFSQLVPVASARVAEAVKLTENVFRAVNVALVNELKVVYDRMGIDVWDVLDAAATKPFGFMRFDPGPGLGGHCIPIDPFFLTWKAREYGIATRFIELAGEVNVAMPHHVVDKLVGALNARGKPLRGARVLLLGLAYKRDVGDCRESPALELMHLLSADGAEVSYHDPHVAEIPPTRRHPQLVGRRSVALEAGVLAQTDAVVLVTDHADVDYAQVLQHAPLIVDTRGVFREPSRKVVRA